MPATGGCVLAVNHLHWIDVPLVGALSPRNLDFVAKVEADQLPGLGSSSPGTERSRPARRVRPRRRAADARGRRNGRALGLFVEGTRQRAAVPARRSRVPRWSRSRRTSPSFPAAIYGTQFWKPGNFAPCSLAFGEPLDFGGLPKTGRGYKEATAEIEARIHGLFDWLADLHAHGRPEGLTPP
jgi:1-acyl-sn-glycerol-3-phosphate acyltransferase